MKLIVGLGNPGKEYENTRHNMGFMVLDRLSDQINVDIDKEDFKGVYGKFKLNDEDFFLLKPYTYMNLSGQSVHALASFFKISPSDIIVVYDDMALPPGKIRVRERGSSGGHKGIQNIMDLFKTDEIKRIRVGIGEPKFNSIDFVLGKPSGDEAILIDQALDKAVEALRFTIKQDFYHAMSKFN